MNYMLYLLLMLSLILCCVAATHAQTSPPAAVTAPAPPPLPPGPVDTFRRILAMSQPDREKFLATLKPENRQVVILKLQEYQGLPVEQREQRLRALHTRVWVRQLIRVPASNRVERLRGLQQADRQPIEERLAQWDRLSPELQKEVLTNETAIRWFANSPDAPLPPFPVTAPIAKQLSHWTNLSKLERTEVLNAFQYFVEDLPAKDLTKFMTERPAMKSLASIASLPKEVRERYIAGVRRFTALTPADRQKFLLNAQQWQKMTPEQRESWRVLAKKLSPAAPPPPPTPSRPNASIVPAIDHASADLPGH